MLYTRNDWYVACADGDIAEGGPLSVLILNEQVAIWRSGDKLVAFEDRCVHRAAALSLGRCEGRNLRCMYHGMLFNDVGVVVEIPGQDVIPANARVRTYAVTSRYGLVWIWMGDPAKADPQKLPEIFPDVNFDDYVIHGGVLDFQAEARLVSDNLLDFSHLPYVHAASFQSPMVWVEAKAKLIPLERGVRFQRWMENAGPSGQPGPHDHWMCYDYLVPGVLIMWLANFPVGTARALDFGQPDRSSPLGDDAILQIQTITPTAERSSRYHFIAGTHRERTSGALPGEALVALFYQAFNEDRVVIEAQQRVIDRDPTRPVMPTVHDQGVLIYNRLKARLLADERTAGQAGVAARTTIQAQETDRG